MENQQVLGLYKSTQEFIQKDIIPKLKNFNEKNIKYLDTYIKLYEEWKSDIADSESESDKFSISANLHRQLESNLQAQNKCLNEKIVFELYNSLQSFLKRELSNIDESISLPQKDIHFRKQKNDTWTIGSAKKIKSASFSVGKSLYKTFKRKGNEYNWTRKFPLRNLTSHYILNNYLNRTLKNFERYIEAIGKNYINLLGEQKAIDTAFINSYFKFLEESDEKNFEEIFNHFIETNLDLQTNINSEFNELLSSLSNNLENEFSLLEKDYRVAGTLELPGRRFKNSKLIKETSKIKTKLEKSNKSYTNFVTSVFDRKEFYEDLLWFSCLLLSSSYNSKKYSDHFINKSVRTIIDEINNALQNSVKKIKSASGNLSSVFKEEKELMKRKLDQQLLPSLINLVSTNKMSDVLANFTQKLKSNLNEFEKEYTFVQPKNLTYRLKEDQCKQFSPKEIISPIVITKLTYSIEKIIENFNNKVSKLNSTIIELERITEFNLDSADAKLTEEGSQKEEGINIAVEGLLRTINKSTDYYEDLGSQFNEVNNKLHEEIIEELDDLISLSNIDRLITIKIQVSKEKAIQEVKDNLQNYYSKVSDWFGILKSKSIQLFSQSKERIAGISSKVGLADTQIELSEAMADYLVRVSASLDKLPYVYQRLFSNDQLKDERIFIGREEETSKLHKAITYWLNNQIASVMLIGEKGSGSSSLLNIAIQKFDLGKKIFRKDVGSKIFTERDLLKAFEQILDIGQIKSTEELVEVIRNYNERKIIVIENIEDYFIKTVDGFEAITKLMEIITSTNQNILWITTCNTYAWEYLKKVISINDFFIFNIHLKELDDNLIEKIILSRHNISGYDLEFLPSEDILKQKSYKKLPDSEKQEYLKKRYFEQLNKLTANNIAVALFLWLRSIVSSDDEKVVVTTKIELDFSFLKSLSDQKLFALMSIILHDGLTLNELSLIFNMSKKESQLLIATLADDGILFKRGDVYKINFQLYVPIINLLKDKNILH